MEGCHFLQAHPSSVVSQPVDLVDWQGFSPYPLLFLLSLLSELG